MSTKDRRPVVEGEHHWPGIGFGHAAPSLSLQVAFCANLPRMQAALLPACPVGGAGAAPSCTCLVALRCRGDSPDGLASKLEELLRTVSATGGAQVQHRGGSQGRGDSCRAGKLRWGTWLQC